MIVMNDYYTIIQCKSCNKYFKCKGCEKLYNYNYKKYNEVISCQCDVCFCGVKLRHIIFCRCTLLNDNEIVSLLL